MSSLKIFSAHTFFIDKFVEKYISGLKIFSARTFFIDKFVTTIRSNPPKFHYHYLLLSLSARKLLGMQN